MTWNVIFINWVIRRLGGLEMQLGQRRIPKFAAECGVRVV